MSNLTAAQVLHQVDTLLPNQYGEDRKRRWLTQAEGFVIREILHRCAGTEDLPVPDALSDDDVMLVPAPYDELYRHYVESQIHYANGEIDRCNNAATAWNNGLLTYRDFYFRTHTPIGVKALRLT